MKGQDIYKYNAEDTLWLFVWQELHSTHWFNKVSSIAYLYSIWFQFITFISKQKCAVNLSSCYYTARHFSLPKLVAQSNEHYISSRTPRSNLSDRKRERIKKTEIKFVRKGWTLTLIWKIINELCKSHLICESLSFVSLK